MAKHKPAPAPAEKKPEPLLDAALQRELEGLEKLTAKAVKEEEVKVTDDAVTALTLTRALLRDAEAAKKAAISTYLPLDVKDKLDRIDLEAKLLKARAEKLEGQLAAALYNAIKEGRITDNVTASTGCELVLQHRKEVVIDDPDKLPVEFTTRVPDMKAITKALTEHEAKRGAAILLGLPEPANPVPGAHIGEKIVLATKAPELIED